MQLEWQIYVSEPFAFKTLEYSRGSAPYVNGTGCCSLLRANVGVDVEKAIELRQIMAQIGIYESSKLRTL